MLEHRGREQDHLFVACSLRELIPDDHILKQVDAVLDLAWLRAEVSDLYAEDGRPGIDPEAAVRLMLAGFFEGIVHDRRLLRQAQVNLAMRWFAGYRLDEKLPHHSTFTKLRQRWGAERFQRIFERSVAQCIDAGLVGGETLHIDATLIRAHASMESLSRAHAERVWTAHENQEEGHGGGDDEPEPGGAGGSKPSSPGAPRRKRDEVRPRSDPDATLSTSSRRQPARPSYKQHTAVDALAGVVLDVGLTTGAHPEERELLAQVDRVEARLARRPGAVTADASYGSSANYAGLEARGIDATIPPPGKTVRSKVPISRFKYDARHDLLRCPRKRTLRFKGFDERGQRVYRTRRTDCARCALAGRCLSAGARNVGVRTVKLGEGYAALLRARRRQLKRLALDRQRQRAHRWQVEGRHGEGKQWHGLGRAARRGRAEVSIQMYLTAAAMNLKRLARARGSRRSEQPASRPRALCLHMPGKYSIARAA